jgi:integrase
MSDADGRPKRPRRGKPSGVARQLAPRADRRTSTWKAKYIDLEGVERQCGVFKRKGEAIEASAAKVAALNAAEGARGRDDLTLRDWVEGEWRHLHPRHERSLRTIDERLAAYVWPYMPNSGRIPFVDVRRPLLRRIQRALLRRGYAKTTVDGAFSSLSAVLTDAVEDELMDGNPAYRMTVKLNDPDLNPARAQKQRRSVPVAEIYAFMEKVDQRYQALCWAPLLTGCRPNELFAMHGAEIDREREVIYLHEHVDRYGKLLPGTKTTLYIKEKESRGRHTLFPAALIDMLAGQPRHFSGYLFLTRRANFWHRRNFYRRVWEPARELAGTNFDLYDLRHTFASRLEAAGVPEADISAWMGHSRRGLGGVRQSTTRRVYIHATGESRELALATLRELVEGYGRRLAAGEGGTS